MKGLKKILSAVTAVTMFLSAAAIPALADTSTDTNGVKVTYTRNYVSGTGVYSWDFSGATATDTVGTGSDGTTGSETTNQYYDVGGGLSVHNLQLHYTSDSTAETPTYYDIYGTQWVPEDNKDATKYVKFVPEKSGTFSYTVATSYSRTSDGVNTSYGGYYTDDGTIPSKAATNNNRSGDKTKTIAMTAGKTYIIALYSYNKEASMNSITYTVTDNSAPYTVTTSGVTATWSFSDVSALSAIKSFDTYENDLIDSQLSLGSGDTVLTAATDTDTAGITFAGTGFNDEDTDDTRKSTDTVGENGRYMLLAPNVDGTLSVTHDLSRLYLLELNATSINDFNTNMLTKFKEMTKSAATVNSDKGYTTVPDVLKAKAETTMGSNSNTGGATITGTQNLKAGSVYALIYYNFSNTSGNGISAISYTATDSAAITTTGAATTTSDNGEEILETLTYTAALKYLENGYTVASQGFVFVNYDKDTTDYDSTASDTATSKVTKVVTEDGKTLSEVGDAFQIVIKNIGTLTNSSTSATLGIVAVPYITLNKTDSDAVTVWGDPCLPSEVSGYTAPDSTEG